MRMRFGLWAVAMFAVGCAIGAVALAQPTTLPSPVPTSQPALPPPPPSLKLLPTTRANPPVVQPELPTTRLKNIVVTSDLDLARDQIAPSLGATTYTVGPNQIQNIPGGEDAPFQQVLLRSPSVVMDSFGQEHVRGEHANLTYRVNGVILPEGLSGFGQELDTHLIDSVTLIDGSLPAQFGFRTAGIVDVTTKTGQALNGGEISTYGGSLDTYEPSALYGGTSGKWEYFFTGSFKQSGIGIENPTASHVPIHDDTDQTHGFAYLSYRIDDTSRVSLLLNGSNADFQIPNSPDVPQSFSLSGVPFFDSRNVNETQNEQNYYGVLSYQKSVDKFSLQASAFSRYGQIHFMPDQAGDLIFLGVAGDVFNSFFTNGVQFDASVVADEHHTIRAGMLADYTSEKLNTSTAVFLTDPTTGLPISDVPTTITDDSANHSTTAGIYVQDEWQLTRSLTLNYGVRLDSLDANFDNETQLSPRINLVWKSDAQTTFHVGYARYFVPPPEQNVQPGTIAKFANTTNAPANFIDDPPKVERSNYYDVGVSRQLSKPWQVNLDGFYKSARNLIDEGQFGAAIIESPFNYAVGTVYGADISSTYKYGGLSTFGNFAWVHTLAHDIDSQQFEFGNDELAYIQAHNIQLDHDSTFTASAGVSDELTKNDLVYVDLLFATGLRRGFANTGQEPVYSPVNLGYQHVFHPDGSPRQLVRLRFDIVNVFDEAYQLRDGTGVGVGAPQYGQRRSFFLGLAYQF